MRLELEDNTVINDPTHSQVEKVIRSLRTSGRSFAILEKQPGYYMQTVKNDDGSFTVEYQDGSLEQHFESSYYIYVDEVIEILLQYLDGCTNWKSRHVWKQIRLR